LPGFLECLRLQGVGCFASVVLQLGVSGSVLFVINMIIHIFPHIFNLPKGSANVRQKHGWQVDLDFVISIITISVMKLICNSLAFGLN
jgi:hypothetical protein